MMRALLGVLLLLSFVSCSNRDDRDHSGARVRVDVGGHRLEALVEGVDATGPTVILESGLGGGIDDWASVRRSIADVARVVSYSRAGNGGSQPGPRPRTAVQIAAELRSLLRQLEIDPPYLLVGHSLGGLFVRAFAGQRPDEVLGLVLVDPTMEFRESLSAAEVDARLRKHWGAEYPRVEGLLARVHPRMAAIAAQSMLGLEPYLQRLPSGERQAQRSVWLERFADRSQQIEGMLGLFSDGERQEMFAGAGSMDDVRQLPVVDAPVVLLVAGKTGLSDAEQDGDDPEKSADYLAWAKEARIERYRDFIAAIPNGKMKTLPDAGHNIPRDRPDAIVEAIRELLGPRRTDFSPLPSESLSTQ